MLSAAQFDDAAQERISEAAQFEKRLRLEAFLGVDTDIGVYKLRQFTCRDYCTLDYIENKLLSNPQEAEDLDYISVLWQLRTSHEKRSEKRFARWAIKHLSPLLKREIQCFIFVQFNDMPPSSSDNSEIKGIGDSNVPIATILDIICFNYGWTIEDVMNQPLQIILQMVQRIFKRTLGDKYSMSNRITQQARAKELK